jgi:hypothetical protein
MRDAIDLRPEDNYWNIADPGWAYGMLYALIGPLLLGHTTTFYEGGFTVDATVRIVRDLSITNFAGAPTAYRMLMAAGPEAAKVLQAGYFARCLERGRTAEPGGRAMGEVGPRRAAQGPLWADRDGHAGQQPPRRPARRERGLGRLCHAGLPYGGAGR